MGLTIFLPTGRFASLLCFAWSRFPVRMKQTDLKREEAKIVLEQTDQRKRTKGKEEMK